jgi:hypothetical protein
MNPLTGSTRIPLPWLTALVGLFMWCFCGTAAASTTFSLSGDWSNTTNPNGPWSYNQGTHVLPLTAVWNGAGSALVGCNQPAWAPSNNSGDFLPALMKPNSCAAKFFGTDPHNGLANVMPGDIVVHTVDSANGNPSLGVATFHFTVPTGDPGAYQITGSVWDAGLTFGTSRPQAWALLVNGVQKAAGTLAGNIPRSEAQKVNITVSLAGGDTVDLELMRSGSGFGYFVGTNMTLTPVCILTDAPSYNATTGILTMKFTVGTPSVATWNGWLTENNNMQLLWSQSQPETGSPVSVTKTHTLAKSGRVGILSTLTIPTTGITCSSWQTVSTGP